MRTEIVSNAPPSMPLGVSNKNATVLWQMPKNCGQQARLLSSRAKEPRIRSGLTLLTRIRVNERGERRISVNQNGFCSPSGKLTKGHWRQRLFGYQTPTDRNS